jgi:hypothetical protein
MFPDLSKKKLKAFQQLLIALTPFLLIVSRVVFVFLYQSRLTASLIEIRSKSQVSYSEVTDKVLLEKSDPSQIPDAPVLMLCYLGIFMTAEAVFILMAIKEYIQDIARLSDSELIRQPLESSGARSVPQG